MNAPTETPKNRGMIRSPGGAPIFTYNRHYGAPGPQRHTRMIPTKKPFYGRRAHLPCRARFDISQKEVETTPSEKSIVEVQEIASLRSQ
jgi:hypothetical protein